MNISVFETNIRYVGGLLTLYAFTGDKVFKEKSIHIVDILLNAFDTNTGDNNINFFLKISA